MRDQANKCIEHLLQDLKKIEQDCGLSFAVAVEMLKENLEQEKTNYVMLNMQMVRAYGAQTKLPGRD